LNAANGQPRVASSSSSTSFSTEPTLDERFEALDQQVRMIERKRASEQEAAAAKANQAPLVVAGREGFSLKPADGDFQLKLRGYFQSDSRWFFEDDDAFPLFANPQVSARKAEAWAVGLNWYFNRNVKLVLNYEQTNFDGGSPTGDRKTEKALLNRFQIAF
jgi:phosphate-selective porin